MQDEFEILLEETNVISLRTVHVMDANNIVSIGLLPAWLESSIPRKRGSAPKDYEWAGQDFAYLYRHLLSPSEEEAMAKAFVSVEREIRLLVFEKPPVFKLLWTDSGNSVAVFINGEPWAFIDEESHAGYSKGILKPTTPPYRPIGNFWDQKLFEKIFLTS
jgi:hypothetical protein